MKTLPTKLDIANYNKLASVEDYSSLSVLLGMLRAIKWNYWNSHWLVQGTPYFGDHMLFDKLYAGSIDTQIDSLAEKLVTIDPALVDSSVLRESFNAFLVKYEGDVNPFTRALGMEKEVAAYIASVYAQLKGAGALSLGMDDLLMSTVNERDTAIYLLTQRLRRPAQDTMQKVAQTEEEERASSIKKHRMAASAAGGLGLLSHQLLAPDLLSHTHSNRAITPEEAKALVPDLAEKFTGQFIHNNQIGPSYIPAVNAINAGARINEAALAHELGHAARGKFNIPITAAVGAGRILNKASGGSALYHAGRFFLNKNGLLKDKKPKEERLSKLQTSLGLATLGTLPNLAEEARANYLALASGAKRGKLLNYAATLAPSFGGYVAASAIPAIAYSGVRSYNKSLQRSANAQHEQSAHTKQKEGT